MAVYMTAAISDIGLKAMRRMNLTQHNEHQNRYQSNGLRLDPFFYDLPGMVIIALRREDP